MGLRIIESDLVSRNEDVKQERIGQLLMELRPHNCVKCTLFSESFMVSWAFTLFFVFEVIALSPLSSVLLVHHMANLHC